MSLNRKKDKQACPGVHWWALAAVGVMLLSAVIRSGLGDHSHGHVCGAWAFGIAFDVGSVLLFMFAYLTDRTLLGLPMIGWALYYLSCVGCPQPLLLGSGAAYENLALLLGAKVLELMGLTVFHFLCVLGLPRLMIGIGIFPR